MNLLDPLFRSPAVDAVFSDRSTLQGMLDFEASLAKAESRLGIIPAVAAAAIATKCRAELFDTAALSQAAARAGNLAIPLVKNLTALVAKRDKQAARFVHWGATSQDAIDTGRVLQLRQAIVLIARDLDSMVQPLGALAQKHRATLIAGRTWMQHALPTTLGMKIAGWLDALVRHRARLAETQKRCIVLQFGGAVGTLAALGGRGPDVASLLAAELGLGLPDLPWHSHRDRMAEIGLTLSLCVGAVGKIARDLSLHMQTEVAEIFEPACEGRGESSTMPHKRNPVSSTVMLSAAMRVPGLVSGLLTSMVQEDERGLGGWHAEWETLPDLVQLAAGAIHHLATIAPSLEIDAQRMKKNLDLTHGLIFAEAVSMALAEKIGKADAHEIVQAACARALKDKRDLRVILSADPKINSRLSVPDLDRLFDPRNYLGAAEEYVYRVVSASRGKIPAGEE
ncbi:MAG TPA: 3-carboxy-cis,cis-muconate cycloisomerase [Candidatus Acidoferrum sp.]|nr:3-carboxy-cis,cis-muconate cycloisomerase [Candidatus Acidoferrum sp.]